MIKKIISAFVLFLGLANAHAQITCPPNDDVFFISTTGNVKQNIVKFVMPSGAVDSPQFPYASPRNFNSIAIEKNLTADKILAYDPVKQDPYSIGVMCQYGVKWRSGDWSGHISVIIYYCGGSQCSGN